MLNIGWLDPAYDFVEGEVSVEFIEQLKRYWQKPTIIFRSLDTCEFCSHGWPARSRENSDITAGEVWVWGNNGVVYVTPTLIYHYIVDHSYLPPAEFIEAVLQGRGLERGVFQMRGESI
jgi:hypothetical protein